MTKLNPKLRDPAGGAEFSTDCCKCSRIATLLKNVRKDHPDYYAKPVAPFGEAKPQLLIVGLAPGMHGANRTGRPFTGDYAGILLYETLHKYGFANHPNSIDAKDNLRLIDCRITNAVKCLPPENRPLPEEIRLCNGYLRNELSRLYAGTAILALGRIAHQAVLMALNLKSSLYPFLHGGQFLLPNRLIFFDSYHCSRYNTQTRRLTREMFEAVFDQICAQLNQAKTVRPHRQKNEVSILV